MLPVFSAMIDTILTIEKPEDLFLIEHDALIGEDFEDIARTVLCPFIRKYRAARTIQRAFKIFVSKKRIQKRNAIIFQELMETVWAPHRVTIDMIDKF